MKRAGRGILGGVAMMTMTNGYLIDWNHTHLFNPNWPPHAKFHDAWTILLGTGLGAGSLYSLRKGQHGAAALQSALFFGTQLGSFAFPNTGGVDAEFPELAPVVAGVRFNESPFSLAMLALTGLGYALARDGEERREGPA